MKESTCLLRPSKHVSWWIINLTLICSDHLLFLLKNLSAEFVPFLLRPSILMNQLASCGFHGNELIRISNQSKNQNFISNIKVLIQVSKGTFLPKIVRTRLAIGLVLILQTTQLSEFFLAFQSKAFMKESNRSIAIFVITKLQQNQAWRHTCKINSWKRRN